MTQEAVNTPAVTPELVKQVLGVSHMELADPFGLREPRLLTHEELYVDGCSEALLPFTGTMRPFFTMVNDNQEMAVLVFAYDDGNGQWPSTFSDHWNLDEWLKSDHVRDWRVKLLLVTYAGAVGYPTVTAYIEVNPATDRVVAAYEM